MNLKNYTSNVPVDRTIARIEQLLASSGATGIIKDYAEGKLVALFFKISLPTRRDITIRLPVNHQAVYQTMRKTVKRQHAGTLERIQEQALRTSWKLMQDWVEVQLSLIRIQQVDFMQVFLPYVWDGQQTFYAALKERDYRGLPACGETVAGS